MNWIPLQKEAQLQEIEELSRQQPVVIFKHSTRCSISSTALNRLERNWKDGDMQAVKSYYLDLISFRTLSTQVAHTFEVDHESPQLLLIQGGKCIYHASHWSISYDSLKSKLVSSEKK